MPPSKGSPPIRIIAGSIESGLAITRLVIPTAAQPVWPPYRRVSEGIASRGRQLPVHAHEREEVLTYLIEGFASYQIGDQPPERLAQGAGRLLTATSRVSHRVAPVEGASIRWFSLVLGLPPSVDRPGRVQSTGPDDSRSSVDEVEVRRLTGPGAPMTAASGLECEVMTFPDRGTTFRRVGPGGRALVYALVGQGFVDERAVEAGETALAEDVPGVSVRGSGGFRAVFATAPRGPASSTDGPATPGS